MRTCYAMTGIEVASLLTLLRFCNWLLLGCSLQLPSFGPFVFIGCVYDACEISPVHAIDVDSHNNHEHNVIFTCVSELGIETWRQHRN